MNGTICLILSHSFRSPGSVQARLQMEVASPDVNVVSDVIVVSNNLGNLSLNQNVTEVRSEPGICFSMLISRTLYKLISLRWGVFLCRTDLVIVDSEKDHASLYLPLRSSFHFRNTECHGKCIESNGKRG